MPFYSYKCKECDNVQNDLKKMDDRHDTSEMVCKECNHQGGMFLVIKDTPMVSYSTAPSMKTSDNFNARLQEIAKTKGEGHTINTRKSPI